MDNEKEYWQMVYEQYKAERELQGMPITTNLMEFSQQIQSEIATGLGSSNRKKHKTELTPEQQEAVSIYYRNVCRGQKQELKNVRYNFELDLMPLDKAKRAVWEIIQMELEERKLKFTFDDYNKRILDSLTKYFIRSREFDGVLNKGICLFGDVGRGKTFLMQVFQIFCASYELETAFSIVDMKHIAREAQQNGTSIVANYTNLIKAYDDVGFEEKAAHFGNKICVFTELINIAYNKFVKTGKTSHITTNLALETNFGLGTFATQYDSRVADRCKEMYNFIFLGGNSKR